MAELDLGALEKVPVGGLSVKVTVDRSVRPHPLRIDLARGGEVVGALRGRTNPGTSWRWPWVEARFDTGDLDRATQRQVWTAVGTALTPASYVMLSLDGFPSSLAALAVGVPPAATWAGSLLWAAGARWYKVWYYPEGWREGHEKLQGNLPLDTEHKDRAEAERISELRAFVEASIASAFPNCKKRALELIRTTTPSRER